MVVGHPREEGYNLNKFFKRNLLCLVILVQLLELIVVSEWLCFLQTNHLKEEHIHLGSTVQAFVEKLALRTG